VRSRFDPRIPARGAVVDGLVADLVVFDPSTVRSNATYDEPRRFPDVIEHVIVDGTLVEEAGRPHRRDARWRPAPRPRLTALDDSLRRPGRRFGTATLATSSTVSPLPDAPNPSKWFPPAT